jgi:hypothetical protein
MARSRGVVCDQFGRRLVGGFVLRLSPSTVWSPVKVRVAIPAANPPDNANGVKK